ncbi:MAG: hypothetical protein KGL42_02485 [Betaproteobacteria bacterium]|nr:hypothetical protein [Betaproteobacteria bacterium]
MDFSAHPKRALAKVAALHAEISRQRNDILHQISEGLVRTFGASSTAELAVANLT